MMAAKQNENIRKSTRPVIALSSILFITGIVIYFSSCSGTSVQSGSGDAAAPDVITPAGVADGKILSQSYCRSCHMYPEPGLLNSSKWKTLLPQMGLRLGIKLFKGEDYVATIKAPDFLAPAKPVITDEQWQHILDYYITASPIKLPAQNRGVPITRELPFFALKTPAASFTGKRVLGSFVKIDNSVNPARLFVGDGQSNKLFLLNDKLTVLDSVNTSGPVVNMLFNRGEIFVCTIGTELTATSDKLGTVIALTVSPAGKMTLSNTPIFNKLARPVQVLAADLNGDKKTDYLVCEFGNLAGDLCWMENKGDRIFSKHLISHLPGAIKAYFDYTSKKASPDIWVLFAQGEEGIHHYINNGTGQFTEEPILRFPPIYGSSYFEMIDINHDGFKDIIYTCGDNGNATAVLKPYHGIYIFMNDKHGRYVQKYFYPLNGCYKAIARDFDGDGNIDIATISLFTDARQTAEGFVYFKNTGNLNFKPYALPPDTKFERGVTMDAGDLNADGKTDLLIGNAFFDF
ncbi:MAG: VCBS repeat-containing protein, partial [Mucilaginibacter sp.]